jgi:AraC-like DNA-binding protein
VDHPKGRVNASQVIAAKSPVRRISDTGNRRGSAEGRTLTRPDNSAQQATTIGGYVQAIAKALEYSGVDSARVFRAAAVSPPMANDPMLRVPVADISKLYRTCVEVTNNPYFGLTVARFIHISNLHALGFALAASDTLMEFCLRIERYFRVVSESAKVTIRQADGQVMLSADHLTEVSGETEDAFLGFVVIAMRQSSNVAFNPLAVEFRHAAPRDGAGPYEALFRAPIHFDRPQSRLVFAEADLQRKLAGACPELAQINDNIAVKYLARLDRNDVISLAKQKIVEQLANGECTRELIAKSMGMSATALQFKLSKRDTSFHELLDGTRQEMACSYLQQSALPVTEIAFLLGFNDTSNFARAFKRWTGMSPTDFRDRPATTPVAL